MRIKQGMCGLLMLLPLYGLAQTTSSNVIEGYTTQQIADSWWETHNPMFHGIQDPVQSFT